MPIFRESHNVTLVTIKVNQITDSVRDDIDDSPELYLSDLLELIKVQSSAGVLECLRAIRKKIKYGLTVREQRRALDLLELLVSNSGPKIAPLIASDDKLVDVLKGILRGSARTGNGNPYNKDIITKVKYLAINWKTELAELHGFEMLASLYKSIPGAKKHRTTPSGNVFADDIPGSSSTQGTSNSSKGTSHSPPSRLESPKPTPPPAPSRSTKPASFKKRDKRQKRVRAMQGYTKRKGTSRFADPDYQIPQINYKVEAPKIRALIAKTVTDVSALQNALLQLPEGVLPLDDSNCTVAFDQCKSDRRKVLRYLQYVGAGDPETKKKETLEMDDEFLGSLIMLNEKLVEVFKDFDRKCGYTEENPAPEMEDEDSEESYYTSDDDEDDLTDEDETEDVTQKLAQTTVSSPPPRPAKPPALAKPNLTKRDTNTSVVSDPFGDNKGFS